MAFVPPLRPLDSGFRRKDQVGESTYEVSSVIGMTRPFSYQ